MPRQIDQDQRQQERGEAREERGEHAVILEALGESGPNVATIHVAEHLSLSRGKGQTC